MGNQNGGAANEPIAIVGVGCHLPGNITRVEDLVAALREGRDCITEVPPDRWDVDAFYDSDALTPGKTYVRHGGFVHDLDRFDAAFFGIADPEASRMDPQQRMALQTVWHTLENAGQSSGELLRSKTGVFLAMMNTNGYSQLKSIIEGNDGVTGYDAVGDAMSIAAGRISYFLGLEGPCVALDTACSGSMVAVHLACRSILADECDSAIVVGVNAMVHPGIHVAFSKLGLMSRAGRCAAFDQAADGYIRGEGCLAVLLRRQSLALWRRDHIVASIAGTAINQDGRTPAITAPNGASQEKVIRKALQRIGATPNDIGYVEAHGAGTPVGDPIEMRTLVSVYGRERSAEAPLFVGSAKSNFGHLEAGAGLLGLVKAALSLDQEVIFPSLHFKRLNPNIDLGGAPLRVPTTAIAWPRGQRLRMAGVNSFGYSGTNAHAVLQEAESRGNCGVQVAARPCEMVALSAKSMESLRQLVDRWIDFLRQDSSPLLPDIAFTAAMGRTHLRYRLAVTGASKAEIAEKLRAWRENGSAGGVAEGQATSRRRLKTAFVFPGLGAQYAQMGRQLCHMEPQCREAIDRVAAHLDADLEVPLYEVLFSSRSEELLKEQRYAAPALFAIEYALASLLNDWGLEPDYVIGHGVGEFAAACVAGMLELEDAAKLIAGRAEASVRLAPPKPPFVSSVTGNVISGEIDSLQPNALGAQPALFQQGIGAIIEAGCTLLIEAGPQPALRPSIAGAFDASRTRVVATLEQHRQDVAHILGTVAALHVMGAPVNLDRLFPTAAYHRVSLPLYPFRRERHWVYGEPSADGKIELPPVLRNPESAVPPSSAGEAMSQHVDETNPESEATPETPYLYETEWQPKQAVAQDRAPHRSGWLILPDRAGVGLELGALLEARGEQCVIAAIAERGPEALQSRLREAFGDVAPRGVVFLASLDISEPAAFQAAEESGWGSALDLVHALVRTERGDAPRLWLVTRNSQAVGTDPAPVNPAQAPLWGLGKVIAIEHPELRCTKVDLGPSANPEETADLLRELLADDLEDQVAWRNGVRYVARLVTRQQKREHTPSTGKPFRLAIPAPGILDRLTLQPTSRETPGAGQVEIQVHAAGLNFNDVMKAMGIYPGLPDGPVPLGSECSGTVVAVGPEVDGLAVGDAVVAVAPFSFSSYVTAAAPLVVPKPPQISFEEAAAIPLAFLTAVYALRHLGQLAEGDRVLIHSASGGVGLAAVQIAQQAGAEIFATAGSPEKRAFLESLGVHHVMDSRSLTFAREVMAFTGGRGVDVVLNSLAGEGMRKSLEILAPFGRFLEIGKRDIYENRELGLAPFRKHLSYFSIDLERLFAERPAVGVRLLREVMQSFESGAFQPLRLQVFPVTEVVSAFREMAQARHIGKIVVSLQNREQAPASEPETAIRTDSAYLITGGLGGLGLAVAQWMVAQGARHLALMGRSEPSAEARKTLEALERDGAQVLVVCADVAQREQVARALAEIDRSMPPLAGVIHAAGIQDDGVLLHLTRERFRSVMAPKVAGAWNLHTLTADRKLDFFVLFSSAASLIGSPGQGNYAAANAYLDGLAHYRRANGQPALSINWGAWSQVGLAARMDGDERMVRLGMLGLTPQQGVDVLGGLLRHSAAQVGVMRVQVRSWLELFPKAAEWPFLAHLALEEAPSVGRRPHESPLRKALLASPAGQHRRALLESRLQQELARILRINPSQVGRTAPLQSFGLDSISAVELRNRWSEELGLLLSATLIWDHPTISALATHLADKMEIPLDSAEAATLAQDAERTAVVAQIRELSEEQAEALLIQTLSTIEAKRP